MAVKFLAVQTDSGGEQFIRYYAGKAAKTSWGGQFKEKLKEQQRWYMGFQQTSFHRT
jgi:hypothetical protein